MKKPNLQQSTFINERTFGRLIAANIAKLPGLGGILYKVGDL